MSFLLKHQTASALAIFVILVAIFYGSTLGNGFVYDDHQQIEENEYVQGLEHLPRIVTSCTWEGAFGSCKERGIAYYRPLQSLSYLLTFQISSHPALFHLVNLVYFFGIASLVFFLARAVGGSGMFAFFAGLIFVAHPLQSETVNWASAVPELLFALFALASCYLYISDRVAAAPKQEISLFKNKKFIASVGCYFLAMLAKEPAVLLPALFFVWDILALKFSLSRLVQKRELLRYGTLAGTFLLYMIMRVAVLGGVAAASPFFDPFTWGERIYAFFTLFAQYLEKLFWPVPMLFFYSFEKQSNFVSAEFFVSFATAIAYIVLIIYAVRKRFIVLSFALCWIALFLLPVLLFVENLNEAVFSERYVFVSSVGFAFFVAYLLARAWSLYAKARMGIAGTLVLFVAVSFFVVYGRNNDWKNDETLYTATLAVNERAYPIRFNWAVFLRNEKKDFEAAKSEFETILAQNPAWRDNSLVYLHLGDYARDIEGNEERAAALYMKSIEVAVDWKAAFAYDRLGSMYAAREEYLNAVPYFCQATQLGGPHTQSNEERLGRAIDLVAKHYEQYSDELYGDVTSASVFQKSEHAGVRYNRTTCEKQSCSLFFFLDGGNEEIIFPFLIAGVAENGKPVTIENMARSPQGDQAMLEIDAHYEKENITFIFPTCEGKFYETSTLEE